MKKMPVAALIALSLSCTPLCWTTATLAIAQEADQSTAAGASTDSQAQTSSNPAAALGNALKSLIGSDRVQIKQSPDKYTWYVRDYTGMNAASIGYTSLAGDRREEYGTGNVKITFITADGSYVDPEDEDALKQYVVYAQNLEPNTEIKYAFQTDSDGNEYSNLIQWQSVDEIVLDVCKTSEDPGAEVAMTAITPSPDRYTAYVRDYVGRNLAACGYTSLGGDYRDEYGATSVELVLMTDDGSYVDPEDEASLSQWVVTAQDVPANTQLTMTFMTDDNGEEYENLVETCSLNAVTLTLTRISSADGASGHAAAESAAQEAPEETAVTASGEVTPDFKQVMDDYETFMNQYCDFIEKYSNASGADLVSMLADYTTMVQQEAEWIEKIDAIDETTLSAADDAYYLQVTARVAARLAEVTGSIQGQ